jgi:MFS transporter, DHA2 family, methylenomycin A resistance protein
VVILSSRASLALTAGPLAGGGLITRLGWRSIFLVNFRFGLMGLWFTWRYAVDTISHAGREIDLAGQSAAIGALACLVRILCGLDRAVRAPGAARATPHAATLALQTQDVLR